MRNMHPPSPQLLNALRTSIALSSPSTTTVAIRTTSNNIRQYASRPFSSSNSPSPSHKYYPFLQHRHNSSQTTSRPTRLIPRGHTTKPIKPQNRDRNVRQPPSSSASSPSVQEERLREGERERGEQPQTDLASLNVLGSVPAPTTAVDACLDDGFLLDNETRVTGGMGVFLLGGEAFVWRPWGVGDASSMADASVNGSMAKIVNKKGQFDVDESVWGLLGVVWPRPDLLIIGVGAAMLPISPETKKQINSLGVRVEVMDTRNAAAQFNLLATERGVSEVAAALIPCTWKGV